jgi:outer membrane protein OmpA-like peptidoglycan-associated protein
LRFQLLFSVFVFGTLFSQQDRIGTVYFDFDKYTINAIQQRSVMDFIKGIDTTQLESVYIYGYCDDRGTNDYNLQLSQNRVNSVKTILLEQGFDKNKIVIIEGKGRILIDKYLKESLADIRSKNRRVDLFIINKSSFENKIYTSFQDCHSVGDRIFLDNVFFELGSSNLTLSSKKELDRIAEILLKNKGVEFEIRGHVCCTPNSYKDAVDRKTKERKLSLNRAKNVFKYLISRNVSSLRMTYKGLGNQFPSGKGDGYDRRVELLITRN